MPDRDLETLVRGGGEGGGHPDPYKRGEGLQKIFFRAFGPQFGQKYEGGGAGGAG